MIWTVILKNGESFVIHGASFDRNSEVRKYLRGRKLDDNSVAGIVQGNHPVEPYPNRLSPRRSLVSNFDLL